MGTRLNQSVFGRFVLFLVLAAIAPGMWEGLEARVLELQSSTPVSAPRPASYSKEYKKASNISGGLNFFNRSLELELGSAFEEEVEAELPLLREPMAERYVQRLGQHLARHSLDPDLPYSFKLVNSAEVNAFAGPGGKIYVNRGLIEAADNESQLASVMAHEINHSVPRHSVKQLSKALLLEGLVELGATLVGSDHPVWQTVIAEGGGFGAFFGMMKFSRNYERQADVLGVHTLYAAGYKPHAMMDFFQKLLDMNEEKPSKLTTLFSSHPPTRARISDVSREIQHLPANPEWIENTPDFVRVKRLLASLPPAPDDENANDRSFSARGAYYLRVPANREWTDTGFDIRQGDRIRVEASGRISWNNRQANAVTDADGFEKKGFFKPISSANTGALIGRVDEDGDVFLIGRRATFRVEQSGRLFLGINDDNVDDNEGWFDVAIEIF